ncbi:UDP-N-acetylmuramate:L-alanyl-gamma-D-glutamyl-meso-diaminopimelate ligase [Pseudohalioglobus sediminis]|uniref:UDP-N-acetylmuramate--L-alanyl-gamma-D-glutamyl-meso-2,6-diaminoheptandioate ligase n=1 Tax=Pseudohalioglobus sediminis TaxID=2606449 RepID=A0A5B0WSG6_9GAMM|nr:UDP-N-acetylmuramate:L-alanyl-gamma-D-glutamyl-meso-diaminopimelate ligase [Pseudohalioglobus sediminis]KAA1190012.1 UDP-N-acetylmuramate:L-alanyl-gamma-D-glutamyl-meso-diaminopimelate ligase [Pseudohalioglobus sediminis]
MKGHIHILGVCGTFMGGIALLARELGYRVTGSDANVYPPMSTQLEAAGIELMEGYEPAHLQPSPDCVVVGNAMTRGNPAVEYLLNAGLDYTSGPQWLAEHVLHGKWVLAVAGTHGKTSTSSMLAWILEYAGMAPGFLIGGVPADFGLSARSGDTDFFVVEADEYDTAFFDKRSKFVHYRPRTLIINNLEYDHADIFPDLAAIQRQFHHLVRTVPGEGLVVHPVAVDAIDDTLAQGCWSSTCGIAVEAEADLSARLLQQDGSAFEIYLAGEPAASVEWQHCGRHNVANALAAVAAARHVGVAPATAAEALAQFRGVKRRLELLGTVDGITVYDDFAHHPTAIETTLQGLRARCGSGRLLALIEPRSNTMRMGEHRARLAASTSAADRVYWYQPAGLDWSLQDLVNEGKAAAKVVNDIDSLIADVVGEAESGDQVVIMSNGGFGGIHGRLMAALEQHRG